MDLLQRFVSARMDSELLDTRLDSKGLFFLLNNANSLHIIILAVVSPCLSHLQMQPILSVAIYNADHK